MLALYRAGRGLMRSAPMRDSRDVLVDELGLEPSPDVARLERAILDHDDVALLPSSNGQTARASMLPTGVVTFVLTDVVSLTRLWDSAGTAMAEALTRHDEIVRDAVQTAGGVLLKRRGEGDSTLSVFQPASDAVASAAGLQLELKRTTWPAGATINVRVAVHTGEAIEHDGDYFGSTVNRAARLRAVAGIGDILLSASTAELVVDQLPAGSGSSSLVRSRSATSTVRKSPTRFESASRRPTTSGGRQRRLPCSTYRCPNTSPASPMGSARRIRGPAARTVPPQEHLRRHDARAFVSGRRVGGAGNRQDPFGERISSVGARTWSNGVVRTLRSAARSRVSAVDRGAVAPCRSCSRRALAEHVARHGPHLAAHRA